MSKTGGRGGATRRYVLFPSNPINSVDFIVVPFVFCAHRRRSSRQIAGVPPAKVPASLAEASTAGSGGSQTRRGAFKPLRLQGDPSRSGATAEARAPRPLPPRRPPPEAMAFSSQPGLGFQTQEGLLTANDGATGGLTAAFRDFGSSQGDSYLHFTDFGGHVRGWGV